MAESEIERAFATLADALTTTESEINEEIAVIEQQIEELRGRIIELQGKQETLSSDRSTIQEMYNKYCGEEGSGSAVEF
jgi:chromosome segregation ATPase